MKKRIPLLIIFGLLLIFFVLAITKPPQVFYPTVKVEETDPSGNLILSFLFHSRPTLLDCEALNGNISRVVLSKCPQCRVTQIQCLNVLNKEMQNQLSTAALTTPSGRMANGVVIFDATDPERALSACQMTERQSASGPNPVKCFGANSSRPQTAATLVLNPWLIVVLFAAFGAAWLCGWFIVKYEHLHAHLSHDHVTDGPQKYHTQPTPRIGGLILVVGLLAAGGIMIVAEALSVQREYGLLALASLPAFLGGLAEDITKKVGVLDRLLLTILSGAVAAWLLGAVLNRLDIPGGDQVMKWLPFAVVFTSVAVGGIANAINIIDGYNGLAGGFAVIVLSALTFVAYLVSDHLVFTVAIALTGALLGFLAWNWPSGKMFLGDGGAYLLGFLLAELSVLLIVRDNVTPWFPLLLMIYPVFETFFSIYRKKYLRGHSPGKPDGLHFHMLIYKRIVQREAHLGETFNKLKRNNRVAKYIWMPTVAVALFGGIYWKSTTALILGIISYCVFYVINYQRIMKWKTVRSLPFSLFYPPSQKIKRTK
jgi:UDP-GlcNAc:undecaprenyl-phosphate GlcNAc-1-phosphate transferase